MLGDEYTVTLSWKLIRRYPVIRQYTVDRVDLIPIPREDEPGTRPPLPPGRAPAAPHP